MHDEVLAATPHFNLEASRPSAPPALMQRIDEAFERPGVEIS